MRLIAYIRVSDTAGREDEPDRYLTKKIQREKITDYAKFKGHTIVEWVEEENQSGGKLERPKFQESIRQIEAGAAEGMIVYKINRFARSTIDGLLTVKRLTEAGAIFISVEQNIDTTNAGQKLLLAIFFAQAEDDLDTIRESWRQSNRLAVNRGIHRSTTTPFGYDKGEDGILVPNKDAPLVREIFMRRVARESWSVITAYVNSTGAKNSWGNPVWTPNRVRYLVENRVYMGEARFGDLRNPEAHDPIVTPTEWRAAQRAIPFPKALSSTETMSGLLRCQGCRYRMHKMFYSDKRKPTDKKQYVFGCRRKYATGDCSSPAHVFSHVIEDYVVEEFFQHLENVAARGTNVQAEIDAAEQRVKSAENELAEWMKAKLTEIGEKLFLLGAATRQKELENAEKQLESLERAHEFTDVVDLRAQWDSFTNTEKRTYLGASIDSVIIRRTEQGSRSCSVEGCDRKHYGRGLCSTHYQREAKLGFEAQPHQQNDIASRALILWKGQELYEWPKKGRGNSQPITPIDWPSDNP